MAKRNDSEYERILPKSELEFDHSDESLELKVEPVSYFALFKFSTCAQRVLLFLAVALSLISGAAEGYFFIVFGKSIGVIIVFGKELDNATNATAREAIEKAFIRQIDYFGIISAILIAIVMVLFYLANFLFSYTAMKQSFKIRELYFSKVINQDISWHDQNSTGDFASRVADDLKKIEDGMNDKIAMVLYFVGTIISCGVPALIAGWKLTLVGLSSFPIFYIAGSYAGKISTKLTQGETERFGEAGRIADETFSYIKTVVAFNGQKVESKRYDTVLENAMKNNIKKNFYDALLQSTTNFFVYFSAAILLWYGVHLITGKQESGQVYNVVTLTIIFNGVTVAFFYVGAMTPFFQVFTSARGAAEKVFSIIKTTPIINKANDGGIVIDNMKGEIIFDDVNFCYPARREVQILKNFNLNVTPGETVALVGGSGCGKSTIIQLILRFYDPNSGQIFIDGSEVKTINVKSLRSHIGMVGQEPVLFDGTIAKNIRMGKLDATQLEIEEAAKKANAHKFICSFPDGYQTEIGERGMQLSGGQKQRIAIARALVRKPTILLLDEATSALDSHSEAVVQATLEKVSQDCTTLIVAHRLSTVRKADRIVVLENGSIAESGSHDDLMSIKGVYYNLVKMQTLDSEILENKKILDEDIELSSKVLELNALHKDEDPSTKAEVKLSSIWCILKTHLHAKWAFFFGLIASVLNAVGTVGYAFIFAAALNILADKNSDVIGQINLYATYIFLCGLLLVAGGRFFQVYLIGKAGEHLVKTLRSLMYTTMINREICWFEKSENGVGSLGAQLSGDPCSVQMAVAMISAVLTNITMIIIALVIGFLLSWKLSLAYLLFFPIMSLLFYLEHRLLAKENQKNQEVLGLSTKMAVELINNVRTVASLVIEEFFLDLYISQVKTYQKTTVRNYLVRGFVTAFTKSSFAILYFITVIVGSRLIIAKEIEAVSLVSISQAFSVSMFPFMAMVAFLPNLFGGLMSCSRIYDFLSQSYTTPVFLDKWGDGVIGGNIDYRSVSFSYPTRPDTQILNQLNLAVLKGKTVALVGPSGCGKSTIVQLLERFYDADSGEIVFGRTDVTGVEPEILRFRLGIVMQEPNLFSRSIEDNISYGNNEVEVVSKDEIIRAAQMANIHNFIVSLPLGYETVLGDRGTQLSGGQKQRIAIARALMRNPEVLLLDEATSALDSESEKIVQEALNHAKEERTCIIIAHRLKTIVDSDLIAVINNGMVAEKGTHQDLMSQKGLYWQLYNKQHNSNN